MPLDDLSRLFSVHLHRRINTFGEFTKIGEETVIIYFKVRSQRSWGIAQKCWARKVHGLSNTWMGQRQNTIQKMLQLGFRRKFFLSWCNTPSGPRPRYHTQFETPQSVGLLWTSDQPDAQTSTWQHTTLTTDRHPCNRRDSNPQSQEASGRRLTPFDRAATGIGDRHINSGKFVLHWI
jgi:hypothetical protein